jgi:hypothetical protein
MSSRLLRVAMLLYLLDEVRAVQWVRCARGAEPLLRVGKEARLQSPVAGTWQLARGQISFDLNWKTYGEIHHSRLRG